jgi:predicted amidohydrolase
MRHRKNHVRILVGQPHWTPDDWTRQAPLYTSINEEKPRLWLEAFLQKAKQTSCDLVLLPELSVPESLVPVITAWSKQTGTMVIGGSHYHEREEGTVARSPITYAGQVYYVDKIHQAPGEVAPVQGRGLQPGKDLCVFVNSPVGKLGVLICSDYLVGKEPCAEQRA